ncbi:aprataxin and PNK-like factor isoform X2 [Prorops nasuta]|uniref:aprataxin and PNK-like factor isoform X2 n=1 Tax=Prorops nasuta TaxID=863751 RepID=UPI0034CF8EF2
MLEKLQIMKIEDDTVEKIDLNDDVENIKGAVTINLSSHGETTISSVLPCYIKSVGCARWKFLKLGETMPIKSGDICSLLPITCLLKVASIYVMETNKSNLKRKDMVDTSDLNEVPPEKKLCSDNEFSLENENSFNITSTEDSSKERKEFSSSQLSELIKDIYAASLPEEEEHLQPMEQNNEANKPQVPDSVANMQSNEVTVVDNFVSNSGIELNEERAIQDTSVSIVDLNDSSESKQPCTSSNKNQIIASCSTSESKVIPRDKCAYGIKCYRKNQSHKEKFSHPGDSDYAVPDNRPECYYGIKCYRRSEEHKKTYKHTELRPDIRPREEEYYTTEESSDGLSESIDASDLEFIFDFDSSDSSDDDELYMSDDWKYESDDWETD